MCSGCLPIAALASRMRHELTALRLSAHRLEESSRVSKCLSCLHSSLLDVRRTSSANGWILDVFVYTFTLGNTVSLPCFLVGRMVCVYAWTGYWILR